ncbi:MAG: phosphoadenosine phosphosulfate reductase [Oleiphilus sp.]|nr:MAG: phosphoadenosine phosphosulfate reductase [Oleiphilus sp.]
MQQLTIDVFDITEQAYELLPIQDYDKIIIAFSAGKDSQAALIAVLEAGARPDQIELWHHNVDGSPDDPIFMDWPVTKSYAKAVAKALGLPIYFSWKEGGFKGEMLRENALTRPSSFETPNGSVVSVGGKTGTLSTRRLFPQTSGKLETRYCSSYLKIDICAKALTNQTRFAHSKTLVVTGERAEESSGRAKYKAAEPHRTDLRHGRAKRWIDHWRPVHGWTEEEVWEAIKRHKINPHPAYHLGWGRLSCMSCIFASKDQWASIRVLDPQRFAEIAAFEQEFDCTIHRTKSVIEQADAGTPYPAIAAHPELAALAMSHEYTDQVLVEDWALPAGAFGESNGPT